MEPTTFDPSFDQLGRDSGVGIRVEDWGQIDYPIALARQEEYLRRVQEGEGEFLIFCTHPPVVTLGRATREDDLCGWQGPTLSISRGGRATYHGPSQMVIYPILDLNRDRPFLKSRNIVGYLRLFEQALIRAFAQYGIESEGRSLQKREAGNKKTEETGVWVGSRKLASLGIGVRRWVSFHGAAINVDADPTAFQGLRPCGFQSDVMTSLEEVLGYKVNRRELQAKLEEELLACFGFETSPRKSV